MTGKSALTTALRIAVGVAVPTIACFGLYSLNGVVAEADAATTAVILAYPLALIGLIGMAALALSGSRAKTWYVMAGLCFALPAGFLAYVRL